MTLFLQFIVTWFTGFILWASLSFVFALPTLLLWNWLMPYIFGLPEIGFGQAAGLLLLSGIVFGHKRVEITRGD